jgi:hypothetical protein
MSWAMESSLEENRGKVIFSKLFEDGRKLTRLIYPSNDVNLQCKDKACNKRVKSMVFHILERHEAYDGHYTRQHHICIRDSIPG